MRNADWRLLAAVISLALMCFTATTGKAQEWKRTETTDALSGTKFSEFVLRGKFLTSPRSPVSRPPALVVQCIPGKHLRLSGRFMHGDLDVGTVLDHRTGGIDVQYRLDDGKIQSETWNVSTDGTAAFFPETTLNNFLYGHILTHKEGTSRPVRKIVIAVNEYLAAQIVMQFNLLDPTEVGEACGAVYYKKK